MTRSKKPSQAKLAPKKQSSPAPTEESQAASASLDQLPPEIQNLPPNVRAVVINYIQASGSFYEGPIPPPQALAQYEGVLPGAADRIMTMAEETGAHVRSREMKTIDLDELVLRRDGRNYLLGWASATAIGVLGVGGGIFLIYKGATGYGAAAFVTALASIVGSFAFKQRQPPPRKPSGE